MPLIYIIFIASKPTPIGMRLTCERMASDWRGLVEHALLCSLEQVAAVLGQEIEHVGDLGDVFDVDVLADELIPPLISRV
jgi:hypothetical protein